MNAQSLRARAGLAVLVTATLGFHFADPLQARRGAPPKSSAAQVRPLEEVRQWLLPAVEPAKMLAEDARLAGDLKVGPLRFALPVPLSISLEKQGTWERLADGGQLWRLRFSSAGATDLNFGFSRFWLPSGATLHVVSADGGYYEGPFDASDNHSHGQLWTPLVPGGSAHLELYLPPTVKSEPILELSQVATGYRDLLDRGRSQVGGSVVRQGSCNVDVVCAEGDPWRNQIRSVGWYTLNGVGACSGQMIADVPGSFRNLFLTAFHCGVNATNAASMVVMWNDESPTCGALGGGSAADNQSGATFLASRQDADFSLVELSSAPDAAFGVFWTGWDRSGDIPSAGAVGIHHPSLDEKAISFEFDPLTRQTNCIVGGSTADTHWRVNDWDVGTTEPGSSGSGLWNPDNGKLIGTLSGGLAACGNDQFDCYGRFEVAWDGPSAASRLRDHLDPAGTGATMVDGSDPLPTLTYLAHSGSDSCASDASAADGVWEPGEEVVVAVTLAASGTFSGVQGTLSTATPGVEIVDGSATWSDLVSGGTGISAAPHFTLRLAETVSCFTSIDFTLTVTAAEGGPFDLSFSNAVGQLFEANDLPLAIPDAGGPAMPAVSELQVTTAQLLGDVDLRVQVDHTYVGDLIIELVSPAGTVVALLDRPGVGDAGGFGCGDNNLNITFDDASGMELENFCSGATPWFAGSAAPLGSLAALAGENTAGTWRLRVNDNAELDTGVLVDWQLITDPPLLGSCEICLPDDPPPPVGGADLALSKECTVVDPAVSCLLQVSNAGPDPATAVLVTDQIPTGLTFVADSCGVGAPTGSNWVWSVGSLPAGGFAACALDFVLAPGAPEFVVNRATASAAEIDPVAGNNDAGAVIRSGGPLAIPVLNRLGLLLLALALLGYGARLLRRW